MYGAVSVEPPKQSAVSTVGTVVGCLFAINYLIGNGFLAIPYALYHSGLFYGILTLVAVSIMSCITSFWTLEVMSRAQALEYHNSVNASTFCRSIGCRDDGDFNFNRHAPLRSRAGSDVSFDSRFEQSYKRPLAYYEVLPNRKFELAELCEIFLGNKMKHFYVVTLFLYLLFICWAYATVVGTTLSSIIPWTPSSDWTECTAADFSFVYLPDNSKCKETYRFYIAVFGIIVLPLCCLELKDQQFVQILTAVFRFVSIILMTAQSIYDITYYDYVTTSGSNSRNASHNMTKNHSDAASSLNVFSLDPFTFKTIGWLWSIPVFLQAQILQQSIPTMSYQVRKPEKLGMIFLIAFFCSCLTDIIYGSAVAWRYKGLTRENAALNWVNQRLSEDIVWATFAYIILFLPFLDIISLFPMVSVTVANNIFVTLYGKDTSISMHIVPHSKIKKIIIRLIVGAVPIVGAMNVANLFYVTKYAGGVGVLLAFVFPAILQYKSRSKCRRTFANPDRDRRTEDADDQPGSITPLRGSDSRFDQISFPSSISVIKEKLLVRHGIDTPYSSRCSGTFCIVLEVAFAILITVGSLMFYAWFHIFKNEEKSGQA